MTFTSENILLIGSVLLIAGILIQKLGYRVGVPSLLLFLLVGMAFGCDGLGLHFDDVHGAQFTGIVAMCVILFSGGMSTMIRDIRPVLGPGLVLSTVGVLLTTLFTGLFAWWVSGLEWTNIHFALLPSLLLAATTSSTDSASVFGILRSQRLNLKYNLRPMLELESGSNDPMAYLLTVVLIGVLQAGAGDFSTWDAVTMLLRQFAIGIGAGYVLGRLTVWMTNHLRLDNAALYPIITLGAVFLIFSLTDACGGNGYLAVYLAGIIVGNSGDRTVGGHVVSHARMARRRGTVRFIDGLTWLFQVVMFLMLGLLVNPREMLDYWWVGLLIGLFMILVGRPLSVLLSLLPFRGLNLRSRLFVSWVGLRGAAPIIFATYPVIAGVPGSGQIFNIVFFCTILSLVIQGSTIARVASWLGLSEPAPAEGNTFGVEVPEETGSKLEEVVVTAAMLAEGNTLGTMELPKGRLVMMIKRGDAFLVPNGQMDIRAGDRLLFIG